MSICLTTYNRPLFLNELLESIWKSIKSLENEVEICIIDNGSQAKTGEVIEEWRTKLNIKSLRNDRNTRGNRVFYNLIEMAQGDYIVCPGDDDFFSDKGLTEILTKIRNSPKDISMFAFGCRVKYENTNKADFIFIPKNFENEFDLFSSIIFENQFYLPATVFKRELFQPTRLPFSITTLDWSIWILMGLSGKFLCFEETVITYRVHNEREQENYSKEIWELDRIISFTYSIREGFIFDWLKQLDNKNIIILLDYLSSKSKVYSLKFTDKLILWYLATTLLTLPNSDKDSLKKFLIQAGIDPRFSNVSMQTEIEIHDLVLSLQSMGVEHSEIQRVAASIDISQADREYDRVISSFKKQDSQYRYLLDNEIAPLKTLKRLRSRLLGNSVMRKTIKTLSKYGVR